MRKLIFTILGMAGFISLATAQDLSPDDLYDDYSERNGVFAMSLNHDLLDAVDVDFELDEKMKNISGDIYRVKFIAFGEEANASKAIKSMSSELRKTDVREIPLPKDMEDEDLEYIRLFGEKDGDYYKNLYLLILSDDGETGLYLAVNGKLKIKKAS